MYNYNNPPCSPSLLFSHSLAFSFALSRVRSTASDGEWTAMTQALVGGRGTVTLLCRPYVELTITVVAGSALRNADGVFG
jgi:hypothetical protein